MVSMIVSVHKKRVKIADNSTVRDVLLAMKINPETVLVKRRNEIIHENERLKTGDKLELIRVVSGG